MALRGIYDGGGLRKQNGHYQSSEQEGGDGKIILHGTYYEKTNQGNGYYFPYYMHMKKSLSIKSGKTKSFSFGVKCNVASISFSGYPNIPGWWHNISRVFVGTSADDFRWYSTGYQNVMSVKVCWSTSKTSLIPVKVFSVDDSVLSLNSKLYLWSLTAMTSKDANDSTFRQRAKEYTGIYMTCKRRQAAAYCPDVSGWYSNVKHGMNVIYTDIERDEAYMSDSFHTYYNFGANQEARIIFTLHAEKDVEVYLAEIYNYNDATTRAIMAGGGSWVGFAYEDIPVGTKSEWTVRVFKS